MVEDAEMTNESFFAVMTQQQNDDGSGFFALIADRNDILGELGALVLIVSSSHPSLLTASSRGPVAPPCHEPDHR